MFRNDGDDFSTVVDCVRHILVEVFADFPVSKMYETFEVVFFFEERDELFGDELLVALAEYD